MEKEKAMELRLVINTDELKEAINNLEQLKSTVLIMEKQITALNDSFNKLAEGRTYALEQQNEPVKTSHIKINTPEISDVQMDAERLAEKISAILKDYRGVGALAKPLTSHCFKNGKLIIYPLS